MGLNIIEMPHSNKKTVCCGEGGYVGFISQEKQRSQKPPFTYINRLKLKKYFKKHINGVLTREREFSFDKEKNKNLERLALLSILIIVILAVRYSVLTSYFDKDRLHELLKGHRLLAPLLYMIIYILAYSLFLPGLPITIVGGILFGLIWCFIYIITSATAGACLAFLISRYIARYWTEKKLKSPRWRKLDEAVERHGWKIVAFSR